MTQQTLPDSRKKPGRPATGKARTAVQRKRDQRARDMTAIFEADSDSWTEAQCLAILTGARFPKNSPLQKAAWIQIGKLRLFM
ncbi:MAG: hypothetical protein G3I10_06550 [Ferrovum sp.]|jgi:hypothetical protein|nr:hypothetical protein [Ferrovum sp.]